MLSSSSYNLFTAGGVKRELLETLLVDYIDETSELLEDYVSKLFESLNDSLKDPKTNK